MRLSILVVLTLALILVTFTLPTTIWARDVYKFRVKDLGARATFFTTDECIQTFISVDVFNSVLHEPPGPPPTSSSEVLLSIDKFDFCTYTQLLSVFVFTTLGDQDFQVSNNLTSATLNTTIDVDEESEIFIDMTWESNSAKERFKSNNLLRLIGFFSNSKMTGTSRQAIATGSVSDGTTNFTPAPSTDASISNSKHGSMMIVIE